MLEFRMTEKTIRIDQTGLDNAYAFSGELRCIGSKRLCSFWMHGVLGIVGNSENPILVVDEEVGLSTLRCRNCLEPR